MRLLKEPEKAAHLFEGWQETIIWSCLQGVMGKMYSVDAEHLCSAMAVLGDFCFLAGEPIRELLDGEKELRGKGFRILVPRDEAWARAIEEYYGSSAQKRVRYAFQKDGDIFDREKLGNAAGLLPEGVFLQMLDEECFHKCRAADWSRDLVSQYQDYDIYKKLALGVAAVKNGKVLAGASAYSRYRDGIEIEIDTEMSQRRKGLAYACGAKLILECLSRGLYPSWDAQNPASAALAGKLGYHFSHTYPVYEISGQ